MSGVMALGRAVGIPVAVVGAKPPPTVVEVGSTRMVVGSHEFELVTVPVAERAVSVPVGSIVLVGSGRVALPVGSVTFPMVVGIVD